jgi:hypothetical protein
MNSDPYMTPLRNGTNLQALVLDHIDYTTPYKLISLPQGDVYLPYRASLVSDGYHTFMELQDHIQALLFRLCVENTTSTYKWTDSDEVDGSFFMVDTRVWTAPLIPGNFISGGLPFRLWAALPDLGTESQMPHNRISLETVLGETPPKIQGSTSTTMHTPYGPVCLPCTVGQVQVGLYTFDEMYCNRHALFLSLCHLLYPLSWKSLLHNDGTSFEGYFMAGIDLPEGTITYHLPTELWQYLNVSPLDVAPPWDGHTSQQVVGRLYGKAGQLCMPQS